jgi:alkaline phosphatase D
VTKPGTQMPGWPLTIDMAEIYGRMAVAHLPTLNVIGATDPVLQVVDEADGEIVYTVRIAGQTWRPPVFAPGTYTITISDPERRRETVVNGVRAGVAVDTLLEVRV